MEQYELGWTVGFLEGEGWFGSHKGRKRRDGTQRHTPRISCGNTDLAALERLQRNFGGYIYEMKPHVSRKKQAWIWHLSSAEQVLAAMNLMRPLLSERRQAQIDAAVDVYKKG